MTLHHAYADATTWALRYALTMLRVDTAAWRRGAAAAARAERDGGLRSPVWGRRHALGGHGDPTGVSDDVDTAPSEWARARAKVDRAEALAASVRVQLADVAQHLPGDGDPLDRIQAAIPTLSPRTAGRTAIALDRIDARVRRHLGRDRAQVHVPGLACPACKRRLVYELVATPGDARMVVCLSGCRCVGAWPVAPVQGPGCGCGLTGAAVGALHVWPAARTETPPGRAARGRASAAQALTLP